MSMHMIPGPSITVAQGATDSPPVVMKRTFSDADVIGFVAPGTLPETATIQVSVDFDENYEANGLTAAQAASAATWDAVDATNALLPTAGLYKAIRTRYLVGQAIRIHLNGAAAGPRTFETSKRVVA